MNTEASESESIRRVRIAVGLTVGIIASGIFVGNVLSAPPEIAAHPARLLLAPQVSLVLATAILGFITVAYRRIRSLQIWIILANGYAAALATDPGNLTAFTIVLIATLLAARYGYFDRRPKRRAAAMLAGYGVCTTIGLAFVREAGIGLIVVTLLGAVALGTISWYILVLWSRERQQREDSLEERVRARTEDLRKTVEEKQSLIAEQRLLLAELHHRTKNNLQIVSSILTLGLRQSDAGEATAAIQTRIQSLAAMHDRLYGSTGDRSVDFAQFLDDFVSDVQSVGEARSLEVSLRTAQLPAVASELAIRFALALNEVVMESTSRAPGPIRLTVDAECDGGNLVVVVAEQLEIGKLQAIDEAAQRLIEGMMRTVGGEAELSTAEGYQWRLRAPIASGRTRWDAPH